jgi:zinc protease
MLRTFTTTFVAIFLSIGGFLAQGETLPVDPDIRIGTLENGLQYYIAYNAKPEDRVELRLAVHAGSMQEDVDQLGVAHFVEHMAFNGSEHFDKNELIDYLESVGTRFGADLNAYTSFDETVYMLQARTDDEELLDKGLTVIQDWAGGVSFDDVEIDKERGVVVSEWRTRLSANQRMQQNYFPVMFYNSRYAVRLPIGDPEIIENADYDVIKRFYQDWYRPNLMAVVIVGDIDVNKMEAEIVERFSGLQNPAVERKREEYSVPPHDETFVSVNTDHEATFSNIRIMYKHPEIKVLTDADYRESLVRRMYNGMLNARLYELNSVPDPPFVFASSGYGGSVGDIDSYTSFAMVPEGGTVNAFGILLTENKRASQYGFVETELERQKAEMMRNAETQLKEKDKTESRRKASQYVRRFLDDTDIMSPEQVMVLYEKYLPTINVNEVNVLGNKWITDKNRVIVFTGPEKEGLATPTEDELLHVLAVVSDASVEAYVDDIVEAPLLDEDLAPVAIIDRGAIEELDIKHLTLSNGVKVMYKSTDFKNDEVLMGAYSLGGHSLYDDDAYQSARAITSIMRESGLSEFTPPQLDKLLTGKRVYVGPMVSERYEGFNGSCSPEDLETLFQLIYVYAKNPRFHTDGLQAYLKKQETIYQNLLSNPRYYFSDKLTKIRYQDHPRRGFPHVEDLEKVNLDQAHEIYTDRFSDFSDFTFFFTGAFDPEILETMSAKYLGNLPSTNREETWKDIGVSYPKHAVDTLFYKGEAPRSNVQIIYYGDFDWNADHVFVFRRTIDYLKIKLRESLREDLGGVYGVSIYGGPSKYPKPTYSITISFNADPPRTDELIDAAYEVLENVRLEGVAEEDMVKVREMQRQSRKKALKENDFWQSGMIENWTNGTDIMDLTQEALEERLADLTPEDIESAVQMYFDDMRRIQAVLMPESFREQ